MEKYSAMVSLGGPIMSLVLLALTSYRILPVSYTGLRRRQILQSQELCAGEFLEY